MVSIIVPVYNVEKYLRQCLESLVTQSFSDIEIIVVNDGSSDNSQLIIDEYVKRYSFIKSFIKENGGLSDARNYGILYARGEYIAFVDSDDYVDSDMYQDMYEKAKSGDFDIVVCDFEEIYPHCVNVCSSRVKRDLKSPLEVKKQMIDIYPSACNKIYKRELFDHLKFKKDIWFEDVELCYRMLPYVHSIGVVHKPYYKYIQRSGSISKSNDIRIYHCMNNWKGIVEFYKDNNLYKEFYRELEYNYVRYIYATFIKAALKFEMSEYKEAVKIAQENVRKQFPKYRCNQYFYRSLKGIYLLIFNRCLAILYYLLKHR